ncbi:hypothetical protein, partial [Escherichia coli]|uniref:hypothetical protein n=1 Tax=Escherichia coli TaxID=562 RepID=UPI001963488E
MAGMSSIQTTKTFSISAIMLSHFPIIQSSLKVLLTQEPLCMHILADWCRQPTFQPNSAFNTPSSLF